MMRRFLSYGLLCGAVAFASAAGPGAGGDPGVAALDKAYWIWSNDVKDTQTLKVKAGTKRKIRKMLVLPEKPDLTSATLVVAVLNTANIRANDNLLGEASGEHPTSFDLLPHVTQGRNELLFEVTNKGTSKGDTPAGLLGAIYLEFDDGATSTIVTDKSWQAGGSSLFPNWEPARELAPKGKEPWAE